jgi:uncharacterized membrane protein
MTGRRTSKGVRATRSIERDVVIEADPVSVWNYLVRYENYPRWMQGLRTLDTPPATERAEKGSRIKELWRLGWLSKSYEVETMVYEPPARHVARATDGDWEGEWVLHALDERTRVEWRLTYRPPFGLLGAIADRLWSGRRVARILERSLERLKSQVEAQAHPSPVPS